MSNPTPAVGVGVGVGVGVEVLCKVLIVARGVALNHRSRCGLSRTQRARGSRQRRREPSQAEPSDTLSDAQLEPT